MTSSTERQPRILLTTLGHYHPENNITNDFFDRLEIGSEGQWVAERTGIRSRRSVLPPDDLVSLRQGTLTLKDLRAQGRLLSLAEMAYRAWEMTQRRDPTPFKKVDAAICGTSIPDYDIPANACFIAARLGLDCVAFDANSACSSFVLDLHVARSMLRTAVNQRIAIFNPERYSIRLNYADRKTCVLFGDGSAAGILESATATTAGLELLDTVIESDPARYDLVKIPYEECFDQNGAAVQKFAITKTVEVTRKVLERNGLTPSDCTYFIGHQANLRMVTSAAEKLGLHGAKHLYNVDEFGNQGSAGAPSVLSMNWERFKPGDIIVLAVVGSGLTWGAALFRRV
jgi:3-oxoacyl-[acyl-carrier-protein] synthase-3